MKLLTTKKRTIRITGRLIFPIEIGLPAWIQEFGGMRRTSPVLSIVKKDAKHILIETPSIF